MSDKLSNLAAVCLARAEELAQERPNAAMLAACDLFMADAVRASYRVTTFVTHNQPRED
jgi:hypothetical protein